MVPEFEQSLTLIERLESKSVLLVEDSADAQLLVRILFRHLMADLVVVGNGGEALEAISQKSFDLILMDLDMPVLDGFQTLAEMHRRDFNIPVIAISAHAMSHVKNKCDEAGFAAVLTKPFSLHNLEFAIIENHITLQN